MADVHLSDMPPPFRSLEPDWFAAMERQLLELDNLAKLHGNVPILCAGDVFHRWNPSPRLINFAIRHLPHCYAVPGQHDLRHHSLSSLRDTAYWTLCKAGKLTHLKAGNPQAVGELLLWGFPWGVEPSLRPEHATLETLHVAVIHRYVWTERRCYPGAPVEASYASLEQKLSGYDAAVSGDNHLSFLVGKLCNPGGFFRRNSDQREHQPAVGLLRSSGRWELHHLNVSEDKLLPVEKTLLPEQVSPASFEEFLDGLSTLRTQAVDFRESVYQACRQRGASEEVLAYVREALGES